MALPDVSENANKVYDAMKQANLASEEKMSPAESITRLVRLPKNLVANCLQELQAKGYVKRKAREKSSGYYIVKLT